jgi:hypothetical protein
MPTLRSIPAIETALSNIELSSLEFAQKATAMSEIIESVNARLRAMPGKMPVSVDTDEVRLSFDKRDDWGLWIDDGEFEGETVPIDSPQHLCRVSIARKARAFPLLADLLRKIEAEQCRQTELIQAALVALETLEPAAGREGR